MSGIICARHGRTSNTFGTGLCGEPRSRVDAEHESGETRALRAALGVPPSVCGRAPLAECARCPHPEHPGSKCSTMLSAEPPWYETRWCDCADAKKE